MSELKSRYDVGWFSAYDTLKGMVILYGYQKVLEALMEIGDLTQDAKPKGSTTSTNGTRCAECGSSYVLMGTRVMTCFMCGSTRRR